MQYIVDIQGVSPLLMHNVAIALDPDAPSNIEKAAITKGTASKRTKEQRDRLKEIDVLNSFWLTEDTNLPTIPRANVRAMIEAAARQSTEGPKVRSGLRIDWTTFTYDVERYGTDLDELCRTTLHTAPVRVQQNRLLRHRAGFDLPWSLQFVVTVDTAFIDENNLTDWIDRGGQHIGLGDWRPQKSGDHGRFELANLEEYGQG